VIDVDRDRDSCGNIEADQTDNGAEIDDAVDADA